jgi:hypothetical protein
LDAADLLGERRLLLQCLGRLGERFALEKRLPGPALSPADPFAYCASARELARLCRPGGKIGLANWTPGSMVGELFKLSGRNVPAPVGVKSPTLSGTEGRLRELFGDRLSTVSATRRHFAFR